MPLSGAVDVDPATSAADVQIQSPQFRLAMGVKIPCAIEHRGKMPRAPTRWRSEAFVYSEAVCPLNRIAVRIPTAPVQHYPSTF